MTTYGLTATGFVRKDLVTIKAEIDASLQAAFGMAIDLNPNEPLGQLCGILAEREALLWENAEDIYYSFYPDTAAAVSLDNLSFLTGIVREPATYSIGFVTFTRTVGVIGDIIIPLGFQVAVVGATSRVFATTGAVTMLAVENTKIIPVQSTVAGPVVALAGTLTVIVSGLYGVASATNALDITAGVDAETDAALRFRRVDELQNPGTSSADGIRTALLALAFVDEVLVVENETDAVDGDGRPAHSFEAYVGDDGVVGNHATIAATIWDAKPAGIATHGDIPITVTDSQGFTHVVNFSHPSDLNIYVVAAVVKNTDPNEGDLFPVDGLTQVAAAILAYGNGLTIGRDVVYNRVYAAIAAIDGVVGITLTTGIAPGPVGVINIVVAYNQIARFDSGRIAVT